MIPPPSPQRAVLTLALLASLAPLSLSQPADGCVFDPTKPPCASFELSSSQSIAMLEDLCNDDAGLPACTILRICASDPTLETLTFCSPFSILSAACYSDGSSLRGCRTYTQLCRPASLVRQCAVEGPPKLPSKQDLLKLLTDGCSREWGPECEPCITRNPSEPLPEEVKKTGSLPRTSYPARSALSFAVDPLPRPKRPPPSCEPLTAYSLHCQSYPDLPSCNAWTTFCDSAPVNFLPVCKPIPPPPPPPPPEPEPSPTWVPYLHVGEMEYVLFDWAVTRSKSEFLLSLLLPFFIGVLYEAVQCIALKAEKSWEVVDKKEVETDDFNWEPPAPPLPSESTSTFSSLWRFGGRRASNSTANDIVGRSGLGRNSEAAGEDEVESDPADPLIGQPRSSSQGVYARIKKTLKIAAKESSRRTTRLFLRVVSSTLLVAVILLVATFNAAICGAVIAGFAVGAWVFAGTPSLKD